MVLNNLLIYILSERIAYGRMEGQRLFKRLHIVITPLAGVIRGMDSNSKITSDNQHRDVKAQTYTSSQCKIFKKSFGPQLSAGAGRLILRVHTLPASRNTAP